jgi:AcrR family transcriptional regulator
MDGDAAPKEIREGSGAETRERILVEASRLFAVQGYHGTTTREIAAEVGISQPSLFFHFPTKKAIVEELCRLDLVPAVSRIERLIAGAGSAAAKLYALVAGEVACILASPYDLRAHLAYEVLNDPDLATYRDLAQRFDDATRDVVRDGCDAGEFIEVDPAIAQQLVVAVLLRAPVTDRHIRPNLKDAEAQMSAALVLRSLLADPGRLDEVAEEAGPLVVAYCAV